MDDNLVKNAQIGKMMGAAQRNAASAKKSCRSLGKDVVELINLPP